MFCRLQLRRMLVIFCSFLFQACVTTTAVWQSKKYEPEKSGIIFYDSKPNIFDSEALQKRRSDAMWKMKSFCEPQDFKIVSEKTKEEVTGYQTTYQSHKDNPNPSYHKEVRASNDFYTESVTAGSASRLFSQATKTEHALTRERLYIRFVCK